MKQRCKKRMKNETLTVLNLPAFQQHGRNNSPTSLPKLLTNLASPQPLDCRVYHHPHATERTTVSTTPRCFVVNLMRYRNTLVKSFRRVTYPLGWAPQTQSLTHDLVGVVRHLGTNFHRPLKRPLCCACGRVRWNLVHVRWQPYHRHHWAPRSQSGTGTTEWLPLPSLLSGAKHLEQKVKHLYSTSVRTEAAKTIKAAYQLDFHTYTT